MKRAIVLAGALLLSCLAYRPPVHAQSLAPVPRIGVLRFTELKGGDQFMEAFRLGLRELGYIEGKNLAIEWRSADANSDRAGELAADLVRLKVSIIVASGTLAAEAAQHATRKIPIVLASVADARGSGFVRNLARPGGNITGVSLNYPETTGKQLELLRQAIPGLSRVAFLGSAADSASRLFVEATERAGQRLGIQTQVFLVGGSDEFEGAFAAMRREQAGALIVQPVFLDSIRRIVELANRNHLPTVSFRRSFAEAGLLFSYGADQRESWRRAAIYVDKILKGAKPGNLSVAEPSKYELVVNLKTAKTLGLTIPQAVVGRADSVIQ
ncbi:MAG TPA: ABC transporter substrate-binding protein [Methylomirabilota bacterium]